MTSTEREELLSFLDRSRGEFIEALEGVGAELAVRKHQPDTWSLLECAEHVAVVESAFARRIAGAPTTGAPEQSVEREQKIRHRGADRSNRVEAPLQVRPTGRFQTIAEALQQFEASRAETVAFVKQCPDMRELAGAHPLFGPLNGFDMVLFVCTHSLRHAEQVRELRALLG